MQWVVSSGHLPQAPRGAPDPNLEPPNHSVTTCHDQTTISVTCGLFVVSSSAFSKLDDSLFPLHYFFFVFAFILCKANWDR